jgi:hypothetical protein
MKRIITLLLAVMTAVSLVACGDKASATVDAAGLGKALAERVQFDTALSAIDAGDYLELPEKCEASAYMSDGSTVEEIFVVQCSDKTDASAVKVCRAFWTARSRRWSAISLRRSPVWTTPFLPPTAPAWCCASPMTPTRPTRSSRSS